MFAAIVDSMRWYAQQEVHNNQVVIVVEMVLAVEVVVLEVEAVLVVLAVVAVAAPQLVECYKFLKIHKMQREYLMALCNQVKPLPYTNQLNI